MEKNCMEMAKALVAESARLLREKSPKSTLVERFFLLDEAWRATETLPQPLIQSKGLQYVLERCSLPIDENDLLLGRYDDHVPNDEEEKAFWELVHAGRDVQNPIVYRNGGHLTMDYPKLYRLGIPGYIELAKARIARAEAKGESENGLNQLRGMLAVYEAFLTYIRRYGEEAARKGRRECAACCERLAQGAPQTFRDALQLNIFLMTIYYIYAGPRVTCLTMGRLDDDLLSFYEHDLENGIMTREEAGALIDDYYSKTTLHLGRGEHQMMDPGQMENTTGWERNVVFDSPTYVVLGGYSTKHPSTYNPLTLLMVERIDPRLENPFIVFRYNKEIDERILNALCQKVAANGSIAIYNDDTMVPAYLHSGIDNENAVNYSIHPCNWADISSNGVIVGSVGGYLPQYLMDVLTKRTDYQNLEEIIQAFADHFRESLQGPFADYRRYWGRDEIPSNGQLSLHDCFIDGCLEHARGQYDGGSKYPAYYALIRNIGTAADMLTSIQSLVFEQKVCTFAELMHACEVDFEGMPALLHAAKNAPKYGTDNEFADALATRLMNICLDILDEESKDPEGQCDVLTLNVTINDMNHIGVGWQMGATPDGRLAHKPVSENLSPTVGYCESITALFNSVARLPFDRIHSGALNVRVRSDVVKAENGLALLRALLTTYFQKGGMQVQVSIADAAVLREAQKCPECYRDLMVRITGYSAVFVDMSTHSQNEIIRRDENS